MQITHHRTNRCRNRLQHVGFRHRTFSEPGALCAERFRTRILVCSSVLPWQLKDIRGISRICGCMTKTILVPNREIPEFWGNQVLSCSWGFCCLSLRLAPSVSVAATCENAVAAVRRPTGVLSFECCMAHGSYATLYRSYAIPQILPCSTLKHSGTIRYPSPTPSGSFKKNSKALL